MQHHELSFRRARAPQMGTYFSPTRQFGNDSCPSELLRRLLEETFLSPVAFDHHHYWRPAPRVYGYSTRGLRCERRNLCFYLPLLWSLLSLSDSCAYSVPEHRGCEYKSVAQQDFGEVVFVLVAPLPADRPAASVPDTPRRDTGDIRRQSRVR